MSGLGAKGQNDIYETFSKVVVIERGKDDEYVFSRLWRPAAILPDIPLERFDHEKNGF